MRTTRRHGSAATRRAGRRRPGIVAAAVLVGLLGSGGFVWHSTEAAFTATTNNASNSWATGSVSITDDDSGTAMFTATNLKPGDTGTKCIRVTYGGSVTASGGVKFYATAFTDSTPAGLGAAIDLVVDVSADNGAGTFANCGAFAVGSNLYTGTLTNLTTANNSFANGLGTWTPANGTTRTYRIQYTLNSGAGDSLQGKSASVTFNWEARS